MGVVEGMARRALGDHSVTVTSVRSQDHVIAMSSSPTTTNEATTPLTSSGIVRPSPVVCVEHPCGANPCYAAASDGAGGQGAASSRPALCATAPATMVPLFTG